MPLAHLVEPSYGEYRRTSAQNGLHTKIWSEHVLGWEQDSEPGTGLRDLLDGAPEQPDRPRPGIAIGS
jgi:threonine-phosphate decarboxylase